mmetsp:Transcript_21618/g.30287  ORF Transcript_21618/g.30287 Transcript_21618/m.30287 type:complete len:579 (+) Transcript_21618:94-1830(+)
MNLKIILMRVSSFAVLTSVSTGFVSQRPLNSCLVQNRSVRPISFTARNAPSMKISPFSFGRKGRSMKSVPRMSEAASTPEPEKKSFLKKLKSIVPPASERKKLLPLGLMFFCILFNYTILRDTKDVLMVTAPKSGAEVIPFIKTYVNLPVAIGFTALYSKLCDKFEQKEVFYICTVPFLIFFSIFAMAIYPNTMILHPHALVDSVASMLPSSFAAPLSIIRNWSYALFYVMAEMWGSVVASLLFWGFANEVTTVDEAKKYYPLFGMGANVALIFSGQYVKWVSKMRANLPPGVDAWGLSLKYLMGAVFASGGAMLSLYNYMQKNVMTDPNCVDQEKQALKKTKKKVKMGLRESAKFLLDSPYIRDLAMLVISYGMCINIVEVSWKAKLKQAFPNPNEYSAFMGNFSSATGAVTLVMMLLGRTIFEKFGWRIAALVTPTMIGVTGAGFFALQLFAPAFAPVAAALGTTPLMLAVLIGAAQNILSKSSKYSLFDPCKEMAYIPLDQDSKTKGKAAVDVIGNPLGKSGGSLIQQFLIFGLGSLAAATPYLAVILFGLISVWFKSANSLAGQFEEAMEAEAA